MADRIEKIVVAGGDDVAPMVAAALALSLGGQDVTITVVESGHGSGAAGSSLPQSATFHAFLGISPADLVKQAGATFKLGADYTDWPRPDHHFVHPYAEHGTLLRLVPFHHYWVRQRHAGDPTPIGAYSLGESAAREGRFALPEPAADSIRSTYRHGFHVDRGAYARVMRTQAQRAGVRFVPGTIDGVALCSDTGFIQAVTTDEGQRLEGDLFIDCTGERARLIGEALGQTVDDRSDGLPCDGCVALSVRDVPELSPLTSVVRKRFGWSRRIPLQDRSEYQYYYNRSLIDGAAVENLLRQAVGRESAGPVRHERLRNGWRRRPWFRNCVAIGRSGGYLEPLCISGLTLAASATLRLLGLFPDRACDTFLARQYNRLAALEHANALDVTSVFYASVEPDESPFSGLCADLSHPESARERLRLFRSHGRVIWNDEESFSRTYWASAMLGLGHLPDSWDPLADVPAAAHTEEWLEKMRSAVRDATDEMPSHEAFIESLLAS